MGSSDQKRSRSLEDHKEQINNKDDKRRHKKKHRSHRRRRSPSQSDSIPCAEHNVAAKAIREIISYKDDLRDELRTIAHHLDSDNALDISGIQDEFLLSRLRNLLDNTVQVKKRSNGQYKRRSSSSSSKVVSFFEKFLNDPPEVMLPHASALKPDFEDNEKKVCSSPLQRRILGPSMPPPEFLAAAQSITAAHTENDTLRQDPNHNSNNDAELEIDVDDDMFVGPPPPDILDAAHRDSPPPPPPPPSLCNAEGMDSRTAEVSRIISILQQHEQQHPQGVPARPPDAYAILGVSSAATVSEIKKQYWKVSLLIHPDKCDHPRADVAFQAVSTAAHQLQDADGRAMVDAQQQRRAFDEFMAEQERGMAWKVARGGADVVARVAGQQHQGNRSVRESWMTEMPSSKAGIFPAGTGLVQNNNNTKSSVTAVDDYNASTRGKSLLEKHVEKQAKEKKGKESMKSDTWQGSAHPWRPFDREKDLELQRSTAAARTSSEELLKNIKSLSSKFAGKRSFL